MRKMKKLAALLLASLFLLPACAPAETADLSDTDKLLLSGYWVDIRTCKLQHMWFNKIESQLSYGISLYHVNQKGDFRGKYYQGAYSIEGDQLILLTSGRFADGTPCLVATLTEKEGCSVIPITS